MKVHQRIYDAIKWNADGGFGGNSWVTQDIAASRQRALDAIKNYKELKKEHEERERELSVFKEFLAKLEVEEKQEV